MIFYLEVGFKLHRVENVPTQAEQHDGIYWEKI